MTCETHHICDCLDMQLADLRLSHKKRLEEIEVNKAICKSLALAVNCLEFYSTSKLSDEGRILDMYLSGISEELGVQTRKDLSKYVNDLVA